jgi:hypothetical protein
MNDSKIYIKDLPNIFKVNRNKDYIIEKKDITFKKKNNIDKWPKLNDNKSTNNIKNNNTNINFQKIILTPQKDEKEIYFSKKLFHFNSTILSKKRIKMLNPSLINSNSNPNSINCKTIGFSATNVDLNTLPLSISVSILIISSINSCLLIDIVFRL